MADTPGPAARPDRLSPLQHRSADLARVGDRDGLVAVHELPFLTQLNLRVDPSVAAAGRLAAELGLDLPIVPCRASTRDGDRLLWLGPDEWLLVTDPLGDGERAELVERLRQALGGDGAVTDTSGQRTALSLTGPAVLELLAKGCAIDFHPSVNGIGSCVQTLLAQTSITIVRLGTAAFLLLVRQSFADYLADWLIDAAVELSGAPLP